MGIDAFQFSKKELEPFSSIPEVVLSRREQERTGILFLQAGFMLFISSFPGLRFLLFHRGFGPVLRALVHPTSFIECLNAWPIYDFTRIVSI